MKHKKTLYNWLTNRFLLIIRNEENFAEKRTFSFNYAKIIVFGITFLTLTFSFCFYLSTSILDFLFDPRHKQMETNKNIILLSAKVDSLVQDSERKDLYLKRVKSLIMGSPMSNQAVTASKKQKKVEPKDLFIVSAVDSQLRSEFEGPSREQVKVKNQNSVLSDFFLYSPANGLVLSKYNPQKANFGIEIQVQGQNIKTIHDGTVIFSGRTATDGYSIIVQHTDDLLSVYKNLQTTLKKNGEYLKGGDIIGLSNSNIKFEMWYKGKPLNPENFVKF